MTLKEHEERLDHLLPRDVFLVYQDEESYNNAIAGVISFHSPILITRSLSIAKTVPGHIVFLDKERNPHIIDLGSR